MHFFTKSEKHRLSKCNYFFAETGKHFFYLDKLHLNKEIYSIFWNIVLYTLHTQQQMSRPNICANEESTVTFVSLDFRCCFSTSSCRFAFRGTTRNPVAPSERIPATTLTLIYGDRPPFRIHRIIRGFWAFEGISGSRFVAMTIGLSITYRGCQVLRGKCNVKLVRSARGSHTENGRPGISHVQKWRGLSSHVYSRAASYLRGFGYADRGYLFSLDASLANADLAVTVKFLQTRISTWLPGNHCRYIGH